MSAIDRIMQSTRWNTYNFIIANVGVAVRDVEIFFFSSRRRHTRLQGDWSSDVCSSDLHDLQQRRAGAVQIDARLADEVLVQRLAGVFLQVGAHQADGLLLVAEEEGHFRSEERRVGKECRSRWSPYH